MAGHTDSDGSDADNLALSTDRAAAVIAALQERGVDTQLLSARGYGESDPSRTTPPKRARP